VKKRIRIALLSGGWSAEREVSLKSGEAVYRALDRERYEVSTYDPRDELEGLIRDRDRIDLALILLHGRLGEDGRIQGMLDILQIPFVGSGVLASAMAMNKRIAKAAFRGAGLPVAEDLVLREGEEFSVEGLINTLGPSIVIKPVSEGSSIGITLARGREEIVKGLKTAFRYDGEVMAEKYIKGREITCCVLGNRILETLPPIEIIPDPAHPFFDYQAKYQPGVTKEICPAALDSGLAREISSCAKKAHRALNCRVWSRSDMIVGDDGDIYLLETNTIPGMTETSLFPLAARAAGMTLSRLLDKMITLSLEP